MHYKYFMLFKISLYVLRIMVLNFLNLYTLIFALFGKVAKMVRNHLTSLFYTFIYYFILPQFLMHSKFNAKTVDLEGLRPNYTSTPMPPTMETPFCSDVSVNCTILENYASYEDFKQNNAVLVFIANLTTLLPNEITSTLSPNTSFTMSANGKFNMTGIQN